MKSTKLYLDGIVQNNFVNQLSKDRCKLESSVGMYA